MCVYFQQRQRKTFPISLGSSAVQVAAMALLANEMFVFFLCLEPYVEVYDKETLAFYKTVDVPKDLFLSSARDKYIFMAPVTKTNCLCVGCETRVAKIDSLGASSVTIRLEKLIGGLSANAEGHLMILTKSGDLIEYATDGRLISSTQLYSGNAVPCGLMQMVDNCYAIVGAGQPPSAELPVMPTGFSSHLDWVMFVDLGSETKNIFLLQQKHYIDFVRRQDYHFNLLHYTNCFIFLFDTRRSKIIVLNHALAWSRATALKHKGERIKPSCVCYDKDTDRLYAATLVDEQHRIIVFEKMSSIATSAVAVTDTAVEPANVDLRQNIKQSLAQT